MAQFDFANLASPLPGSTLIDDKLEPWRDALHSCHSGPSRPAYAVPGLMWIKNSSNPWVLNVFDGAQDIALGTINTTTNVFTPSGLSGLLQAANNLSDVDDTAQARSNLGLEELATQSGDLTIPLNLAKGENMASAAEVDLGEATGNYVRITGSTTITSLGTAPAGAKRDVLFAGSLTLTHDGTSLILPGAANIITQPGDMAEFISEGSGNWRCSNYRRADGKSVVVSGGGLLGVKFFNCPSQPVTITIASPAVITSGISASRGMPYDGSMVVFSTTGALPTGITPGTIYYVVNADRSTGKFQISLTRGGAPINTSGTQTTGHTCTVPPYKKADAAPGTSRVRVRLWGGPCYFTNYYYGGGYAEKFYNLSELNTSETVVCGVSDISASPQQQSTFKGMLGGGASQSAGGTASGGDINIPGGPFSYPGEYQFQGAPGGVLIEEWS